MKTKLISILFVLSLMISCEKENETIYYFSFSVNGLKKEYKSFKAIDNLYKEGFTSIFACDSGEFKNQQLEKIEILVKINNQKEFNLNDSLFLFYQGTSFYEIYSAPKIYYDFSISNPNPQTLITDKQTTNLSLKIDSYDTKKGVISGSFSGLLRNSDSTKTDSLLISNGKFCIQLIKNPDKGIFDTK